MIQKHINRICNRFDVSILYRAKVGIKCTNQLVSSDMFKYFTMSDANSHAVKSLFLPIDGLKDSYTLLNKSVIDSPHFELMQMLKAGVDISASEYVARVKSGTLDLRAAQKVDSSYKNRLKCWYEQNITLIKNGQYTPIRVINVRGSLFIVDGKHSAALCAVLGVDPKCVDVSKVIYDSFFWWVFRKMLSSERDYTKHIEFFKLTISASEN